MRRFQPGARIQAATDGLPVNGDYFFIYRDSHQRYPFGKVFFRCSIDSPPSQLLNTIPHLMRFYTPPVVLHFLCQILLF
jgi:hypothetical protein